jgi:hypothetical protein
MIQIMANRLKQLVVALARPEGRMVGSRGHDRAVEYLVQMLSAIGCEPYQGNDYALSYKRRGKTFHNIIGVVPGTHRRKKPVLIGAHYDSVIAAPCADDNAAAVVIALEVARMLHQTPPVRDTIIALFDAEEPPYYETQSMGSIRFYKDQLKPQGVCSAIIMDLVGHDLQIPIGMPGKGHLGPLSSMGIPVPFLRNALFITGAESHPAWRKVISKVGQASGLRDVFTIGANVGDLSDHGIFRRNGIPYLFLSCGRWQHYHEPTDTPDRLNYTKMAHIAIYIERIVQSLGTSALRSSKTHICDTVDLEIASLKRALGPALPLLLRVLGCYHLEDREDLDTIAGALQNLGL